MTNEDRLLAALEYQRAMQPAFGNPNLMRQGRRMNLPARQVPGPVSEFGTQFVSFDQQPDQGYGTMAAEMAFRLCAWGWAGDGSAGHRASQA